LAPTFAFLFQTLSPGIFFFSRRRKEKTTIEEKKNAEKGGSFLSRSCSALSFLAPFLPFRFCPFVSNTFSWHLFLFKRKKFFKKQRKKNHNKEKNVEKGRSLPLKFQSTLSLLAPVSGLLFLPFCFKRFLLSIFFFSSEKKRKKKHKEKKKP